MPNLIFYNLLLPNYNYSGCDCDHGDMVRSSPLSTLLCILHCAIHAEISLYPLTAPYIAQYHPFYYKNHLYDYPSSL